jgi:hypothetical protein
MTGLRTTLSEVIPAGLIKLNSKILCALSNASTALFDKAQRKHLKIICGIFYPDTIRNKDLYERTGVDPVSIIVKL